ncbi:hypothetical protein LSAT2_012488 [Lamellibrachia satsuma]|nr:hypothetical protein LSAT2_012488 [Lamellibrachia satsuma]
MVNYCNVYGCSNKGDREVDRSFFRIPAVIRNQGEVCETLSSRRRRQWLANLNQDFTGKNLGNVRVCSDHFLSGKPCSLYDDTNPDWAPTVGMGNEKLKLPEIRQKRHHRSAKRETMKEASAAAESLLLLQAMDEGASSAIQEEEDLSVGTQTEVDSVLMEERALNFQTTLTTAITAHQAIRGSP